MMDLHDAPSKPELNPYTVLAAELRPGDRIRDRGDLHRINAVRVEPLLDGSVAIVMDDGGTLTTEKKQTVTIWR